MTQLAFSKWVEREPMICTPGPTIIYQPFTYIYLLDDGILAYGAADGSVGCIKVTQQLIVDETPFSFTPTYDITVTLEHEVVLVYNPPALTCITGLKWIDVPGRTVSPPHDVCTASYHPPSRSSSLQTRA